MEENNGAINTYRTERINPYKTLNLKMDLFRKSTSRRNSV